MSLVYQPSSKTIEPFDKATVNARAVFLQVMYHEHQWWRKYPDPSLNYTTSELQTKDDCYF